MINNGSCLHRLMAVRFAIWDLHLYLDTHPEDEEKLCLMNSYKEKYRTLLSEFESQYGPLNAETASGCSWLKTPFPWVKGGAC